jgi:hypothetical protein
MSSPLDRLIHDVPHNFWSVVHGGLPPHQGVEAPHNLPHPHHARDVHSDVVATEIFQTSFFGVDRDAIWRHWHQHVSDDMKRQAKARPITP